MRVLMNPKAAIVAVSLLCSATTASALTVNLNYISGSYAMEGDIQVQSTSPSHSYSGRAGAFHMQDTTGNIGDAMGNFVAWCLDLSTYLRSGKDYEVLTKADPVFDNGKGAVLLDSDQKTAIQGLFDTAYATVSANLNLKQYSGGFQLALWEIVYESDTDVNGDVIFDLGSGNFKDTFGASSTRTDAFDYANQLLAGIAGDDVSSDAYNLLFLESELRRQNKPWKGHKSQNLVTATPVPLPATGLLLLGGLAGFMGLRRRKA